MRIHKIHKSYQSTREWQGKKTSRVVVFLKKKKQTKFSHASDATIIITDTDSILSSIITDCPLRKFNLS